MSLSMSDLRGYQTGQRRPAWLMPRRGVGDLDLSKILSGGGGSLAVGGAATALSFIPFVGPILGAGVSAVGPSVLAQVNKQAPAPGQGFAPMPPPRDYAAEAREAAEAEAQAKSAARKKIFAVGAAALGGFGLSFLVISLIAKPGRTVILTPAPLPLAGVAP